MTKTPETPRGSEFIEAARAERATHADRGWPIEHDRERGPEHPLRLALDYLANGKPVEAGSLVLAALDLLKAGENEWLWGTENDKTRRITGWSSEALARRVQRESAESMPCRVVRARRQGPWESAEEVPREG